MLTSFHHSNDFSDRAPRSVVIDGRCYPASSRNVVAASLLARPDRDLRFANPELTWSRP